MTKSNEKILMKVDISGTIRAIAPGESVTFNCAEFTSYASASGVVSRLNKDAKWYAYTIASTDNGMTYTITHNPSQR